MIIWILIKLKSKCLQIGDIVTGTMCHAAIGKSRADKKPVSQKIQGKPC